MYSYEENKAFLFTEDGMAVFLEFRDQVRALIKKTGAIKMGEAMGLARAGDSWRNMACVDHLVARGELRELGIGKVAGQDRVFVTGEKWR